MEPSSMQSGLTHRTALTSDPRQKRCWNCRDQKIGCDKSLPSCRNCRERGQTCLGYGLKLSWPRNDDKRRAAHKRGHYMIPAQANGLEFINTSTEDLEAFQGRALKYQDQKSPGLFGLPKQPDSSIARLDPFLAMNSYSPVARLVSSSHDANDLYSLLVRISLSDDQSTSLATRHAISALSYQHLQQENIALAHKIRAIRALQSSIEDLDPSRGMQAMAASMLLSIFETLNFESSDSSWSIYFCGTKRIATLVTQKHDTYFGDEALIMDWIFYHDTMYKFSIRHWEHKNKDQIALAAEKKIISKAIFSPARQTVVPILSCSLELLDLLCQVIDSVLDRDDPDYHTEAHQKTIRSLEIRLQGLEQRHSGVSDVQPGELTHQTNVAELFRLATLTYLYRLAKGEPRDSQVPQEIINNAFAVLSQIEFCERPWPLFVIALEARTEAQRTTILTVLKRSLKRLPLGAMALANRMIHNAWIQQDLHEVEMDPLILYDLIISRNRVPPCFT